MTNSESKPVGGGVPTAIVTKRRGVFQSKFWILTVLALLSATGLAWWSIPEPGIQVTIHFPDGHGLHEGDPVRYRGINVGLVQEIRLSERDGVDVSAEMDSSAERLLKQGTQFWIVRPQLALSGVSGLETAVGPKYIAVEPDSSISTPISTIEFEGLAKAPATSLNGDGVEILLRADKQFSVRPGSAVTYRGFEVGKILDVRLSDDARFVDLRAIIDKPHQKLVTSKSKFWANSGVDVDFSLRGGLSLDTESLETIARGGVSFLTTSGNGTAVGPGQVFTLHAEPNDQWIQQANKLRLPTVRLKGVVTLTIETTRSGLLGKRKITRLSSAIPVRLPSGQHGIVVPADLLNEFADETPLASHVSIDGFADSQLDQTLYERLTALATAATQSDQSNGDQLPIALVRLESSVDLPWQTLTTAENVRGVVAVRRPVGATGNLFVHQPINEEQITETSDGLLRVSSFEGDLDLWNGCPTLSSDGGDLIGVLIAVDRQFAIISASRLLDVLARRQP